MYDCTVIQRVEGRTAQRAGIHGKLGRGRGGGDRENGSANRSKGAPNSLLNDCSPPA